MYTAIYFYDVVLSVHIAAIVLAFGVTFAYPVLVPYFLANHPRSIPALHHAQGQIGKFLIVPMATVALAAGIYLASDRDLWGHVWVTVPLIILVGLLALGGVFFTPTEKRAAELAERDVAAAVGDEVKWSPEYEAVGRRIAIVGGLSSLSVLVAIFFMTAKPGGY
jgi:hypothetical protein